jgi:hypothetical protein
LKLVGAALDVSVGCPSGQPTYLTEEEGIVEEQASLGTERQHKLDLGASGWRQEGERVDTIPAGDALVENAGAVDCNLPATAQRTCHQAPLRSSSFGHAGPAYGLLTGRASLTCSWTGLVLARAAKLSTYGCDGSSVTFWDRLPLRRGPFNR